MKSFISIFLIISCIAVIFLKDSLRSIHSLLHYIPNPFHSHVHIHGHGHLHHSDNEHHHSHRSNHHLKNQHQIEHIYEGHHHHSESVNDYEVVKEENKHLHDHDVLEHFGLENQDDESSTDSKRKEEKDSFMIQWYPGIYYHYDFNVNGNVAENYFPGNNNFFLIYIQNPPSPPPEYTLI